MQLQHWRSKLLDALKQRNIHLLFAAGLLIIDLLLTFAMVSVTGRWHSIIIPPGFSQSFWLNHAGVSAPYLAEMTRYFAGLVLNITSDNATLQREEILKYTDPASYGALKAQLIANEDHIKEKSIATSFYPVDVQTDGQNLSAVITGDLKTFVGQQMTSSQRLSYLTRYRYQNGKLLITQFTEVKKNAN